MTDEESFRAAIADSPTDRTIQLAFADWLAERSRPEETAWRWVAAFKRRPAWFRAMQIQQEPYWAAFPMNRPCGEGEIPGGNGWVNWRYTASSEMGALWPHTAGVATLPSKLFRWLPRGNMFDENDGFYRPYNSTAEALDALVVAFARATARRSWLARKWHGEPWVPKWELAESVPDDASFP